MRPEINEKLGIYSYMIVHVQHYLLLCAFLQNDDQLKSRLKIPIITRNYEYFVSNPGASFVSDTDSVVYLVYYNIQCIW